MSIKKNDTYAPSEVDVKDMDYRANWAETTATEPDFIRNKPDIPTVAANTMVFKSFSEGVLTITVNGVDKTLQVTNGALAWA